MLIPPINKLKRGGPPNSILLVWIGLLLFFYVPVLRVVVSPVFALDSMRAFPDYDAMVGTARRPLVIIAGVTQQLPTADYLSTTGGLTTNATAAAGSGDLQTTTATVSTTSTHAGQFARSNIITVATWGTGQTLSDWAPTGLATASTISVEQSSGTTNITGIVAQPTGTEVTIYNRETSIGSIILKHKVTSSSANQIVVPSANDWTIQPGMSITLHDDGTNWKFLSIGGTRFPSLTVDNGATLGGSTVLSRLNLTIQSSTSTGTTNDFVLNSTTTVIVWSGASNATFTGMSGVSTGRIFYIINASSGKTLTLPNLNGGSITQNQFQNIGDADTTLVGSGSYAAYISNGTSSHWYMVARGSPTIAAATLYSSTKNKGTITLSSGTGTATVQTGTVCTCTDQTAVNAVQCAVATSTLTATGTGTDAISYICF